MAAQPNGSMPTGLTGRQLRDEARRRSIMARRQAAAGNLTAAQRNLRAAKQAAGQLKGNTRDVERALGVARNAFQSRGGAKAVPGGKPASGGPNPPERGRKPKNPYPTTPVPFTAEEQDFFDTQEREANSLFQRIRSQVMNDRLAAREDTKRNSMELGWEKGTNSRLFGMNAASQGAGWNPAFMVPGLTGINREWARDANANASNLAQREAALDALLARAREERQSVLDNIVADKAAVASALSGLIREKR